MKSILALMSSSPMQEEAPRPSARTQLLLVLMSSSPVQEESLSPMQEKALRPSVQA
jgi:hypothetical protein